MKKIIFSILVITVMLFSTSCEKWLDINRNPNGPEKVTAYLYLGSMEQNMALANQWDARMLDYYTHLRIVRQLAQAVRRNPHAGQRIQQLGMNQIPISLSYLEFNIGLFQPREVTQLRLAVQKVEMVIAAQGELAQKLLEHLI